MSDEEDKTQSANQEYTNAAFEPDSPNEPSNWNGATRNSLTPNDNSSQSSSRKPSPALSGRRKSSMADIAFALTPSQQGSLNDVRQSGISASSFLAQLRKTQHQYKYVHPFGNTTTILEELLCEEEEVDNSGKTMQSSPTKLLIWIVFCGFMVGVAGAIILGAESFNKSDSSASVSNGTSHILSTLPPG